MRRVSVTTWVLLALCIALGVIATFVTVQVIVRLNRQILASAAELRAGLNTPTPDPAEAARAELAAYAARQSEIEAQWQRLVADYALRYPNQPIYRSVATAQTVQQVNEMRRPASVAALHERYAQAWSDRDAALALETKPGATDADRARAAELSRHADDELRRVHDELQDMLNARGP